MQITARSLITHSTTITMMEQVIMITHKNTNMHIPRLRHSRSSPQRL
jgi:hypothetical protein